MFSAFVESNPWKALMVKFNNAMSSDTLGCLGGVLLSLLAILGIVALVGGFLYLIFGLFYPGVVWIVWNWGIVSVLHLSTVPLTYIQRVAVGVIIYFVFSFLPRRTEVVVRQ